MEEPIIIVDKVSKNFRLPQEKHGTLKSVFTNILKIRNRKIKTQHALRNVSFEIQKGEFFGIIGRNGSGKSTLLKMLAGIYQPTSGQVTVRGKLVPFIELGVGFNPELTGRENVYLNGALLGFDEKQIDLMYAEIVDFAELEEFMDQKLKNYSSGMQVRLAFSMAIRAKADVLLIDEVLAVGDADFQRKCFNYFTQLRKDKATVVLVTHDMNAVREYCDRAMLIEKNKVLTIGPANTVADRYLRLFTEDHSQDAAEDTPQNRWGDYSLKTSGIHIEVSDEKISITHEFNVNADFQHPVAGFRLRDGVGKDITGTNTKLENQKLPNYKKGQQASVVWEIPNLLRDGQYTIDATLQYADLISIADWWNNAATFTIRKNRQLPYPIDPGFGLKVKLNK